MIQDSRTNRYLEVGDRLVRKGKFTTAARVYSQYADNSVVETCLEKARSCVEQDPVTALKVLCAAERLGGVNDEGRRLAAQAYSQLGETEIARRYEEACG